MQRGIFITFEGGEGCGKSSHIKSLAQYFESKGRQCVITREPGGTPLSEKIRDLLLNAKEGAKMSPRAELLLFEASRAQHVDELILPALAEGKIVLCDRFADSSSAYQGVARKLGGDSVEWLNSFAVAGATPDMTILLDIPAELGIARANARDNDNPDRMGAEKISFYQAVRESFLKIASENSERFVVVDSSGEKETTFEKIVNAVKEKFDV